MRKYFNKDGFTLIEALVLAGLLGVLITTFASYQYQRSKQNKARETRNEYTLLQNNLKNSIGQSESLTQAEDREYAPLASATPTATPEASATPEATPNFCPDGCSYDPIQYSCANLDGNCYATSTCVASCTIPGVYTTTGGTSTGNSGTTGSTGSTSSSGSTGTTVASTTTTGGTSTSGTSSGGATPTPSQGTPAPTPTPKCKLPLILEEGTNMCCCPEGSTPQTCNGPTCFLHP